MVHHVGGALISGARSLMHKCSASTRHGTLGWLEHKDRSLRGSPHRLQPAGVERSVLVYSIILSNHTRTRKMHSPSATHLLAILVVTLSTLARPSLGQDALSFRVGRAMSKWCNGLKGDGPSYLRLPRSETHVDASNLSFRSVNAVSPERAIKY